MDVEAMEALNPKSELELKKAKKILSNCDCKFCTTLCLALLILIFQIINLFPKQPLPSEERCHDERVIHLNPERSGGAKVVLCKNSTESHRYHTLSLYIEGKEYTFNRVEAEFLRYFVSWCVDQNPSTALCKNYNYHGNITGCYKVLQYKNILACYGERSELLYFSLGDNKIMSQQVNKLKQIVIYWF